MTVDNPMKGRGTEAEPKKIEVPTIQVLHAKMQEIQDAHQAVVVQISYNGEQALNFIKTFVHNDEDACAALAAFYGVPIVKDTDIELNTIRLRMSEGVDKFFKVHE